MSRCAACQHEFSVPPGTAVPFRCPSCGMVVLGHYCDLEWIGGGGMGDVYRARDPQMGDRTVAVKIPLTEINAERAVKRFEREIVASARLQHENAVRAYQRGEEAGRPYLVMEFVAGRKLSEMVRQQHPLAARRVAKILLGLAKGLEHGQQQGVVNRDIKPDNILLAEPEETPKILDYGLALITDLDEQVTRHGSLLGTLNYVAPEQVRDPHSVTVAADVYSLGCTAFFCLAARPPFKGENLDDQIRLHSEGLRPSARALRPDVAEELDRLIREMMGTDWRARPAPSEIVKRLTRILPTLDDQPPSLPQATDGVLVDVACPGCGASYHLGRESLGRRMRCPNKLCGKIFLVQSEADATGTKQQHDVTEPMGDAAGVFEAEVAGVEEVEAAEVAEAQVADAEAVETVEVFDAQIADAEPVEATDAQTAGVDSPEPEDELPVEIATAQIVEEDESESAVETLPMDAVVAVPTREESSAEPDVPMVAGEARAKETPPASLPSKAPRRRKKREPPSPKAHKSPRELRALRVKRLAMALVVVLCVTSGGTLWVFRDKLGPPSADDRWAELTQLYDEHKWDRFGRRMDDFAADFPEDPRVAQIPFFQDMAKAGDDVYSLTGNAERGLETIQQIFRDHRDNPAYKEYSIDLYQGLTKLIERLLGQAVAASDEAGLGVVRDAFGLLETIGQSRNEPFVQEKIDELRSKIARSDHTVAGALARQHVLDLLEPEKIADPDVNLDAIYDEVERTMVARADLRDDPELIRLLGEAYREEPHRVRFESEAVDAGATLPLVDPRDRTRQGCTLVVAWGGEAGAAGDDLPPDPERIVLALARGILYAFDKQSGELVWARRLGVDSHRLPTPIDPTETSGAALIAVNSEDNRLLALDRATGQVLWRYRVGHDVVAPLTIVPRQPDPNVPETQCGLLPTVEGDIHVLELVLGKRLGRFVVGQPLTLGGCYDTLTKMAFFPADAERIFAIDPAAIDDPQIDACHSILFGGHASGALRCEPIVVGQYVILLEASELEHTLLRAFTLRGKGFADPRAEPLQELSLDGWAWFSPHATPDRITLVTDQGDLGLFGLNLDNEAEAIYSIVEQTPGEHAVSLSSRDAFRTMAVWTEEHLVWIMAGGRLQKLAVDLLGQEIRPLWSDAPADFGVAGVPVHEPQVDRQGRAFYLTTMSASGQEYRLTAVDAETGRPNWRCRLGLSVLGDPVVWEDRVVIVDRSGQTLVIRPGDKFVASDLPRLKRLPHGQGLPEGADESRMLRLGEPPEAIHLIVPLESGNQLAVRTIAGPNDPGSDWELLTLPHRLHDRPCVCDDFLVVPCDDGQLYRVPLPGHADETVTNEITFTWARFKPPGPNIAEAYRLGSNTILLVDDHRLRLQRLELQTADGVVKWKRAGREFFLPAPVRGHPLIADQGVFVLDAAGTLHLLDPNDPNHRLGQWPVDAKVTVGPFLRSGRLLAITDDQRIICLAPDGLDGAGQSPWISEPFRGRIRGMPAAAGDTLLVADSSRYISGVRLDDGTVAGKAPLGVRVGPSAAPVPYGTERMLVPLADGTLLVLPIPKEEPAEAHE